MSFSFVAIGDVHLDSPSFLCREDRIELEESKRKTFKKAVDIAIERDASAFLICGDLYNQSAICFDTYIFLRKCFLVLKDIKYALKDRKIIHKRRNIPLKPESDFP